jgi:hypothetical protein
VLLLVQRKVITTLLSLDRIGHSIDLAQLMSFCSQTFTVSSLSMMFTPPQAYSSCCNITFVKYPQSDSSEQFTINILNMSTMNPSLSMIDQQMKAIKFSNYSSSNRSYLKSDLVRLPVRLSLCSMNVPSFEILMTNLSKGKSTAILVQRIRYSLVNDRPVQNRSIPLSNG